MRKNIDIRKMKPDSIKAVYRIIAQEENISRMMIAQRTGLSVMTVGKITDAFLGMGLISQSAERKKQPGRKAGLLKINPRKYSVLIDLSDYHIQLVLINASDQILDRLSYTYNDAFYYEENLCIFLRNVSVYLKKRNDFRECIGIGVLFSGVFDPTHECVIRSKIPELCGIRLGEIIEQALGMPVLYYADEITASAENAAAHAEEAEGGTAAYLRLGKRTEGALLNRGEALPRFDRGIGSFGDQLVNEASTLDACLAESKTYEEHIFYLSYAVCNLCQILNPRTIFLDGERVGVLEDIILQMRACLTQRFRQKEDALPRFVALDSDGAGAWRYMAEKLTDIWLDSLLLE